MRRSVNATAILIGMMKMTIIARIVITLIAPMLTIMLMIMTTIMIIKDMITKVMIVKKYDNKNYDDNEDDIDAHTHIHTHGFGRFGQRAIEMYTVINRVCNTCASLSRNQIFQQLVHVWGWKLAIILRTRMIFSVFNKGKNLEAEFWIDTRYIKKL